MNVVLGHGRYDDTDRKLVGRIRVKNLFLALPPEVPDYPWLQKHYILRQTDVYDDYDEFLYYAVDRLRYDHGRTILILPEKGGEKSMSQSPILLSHRARLLQMTRLGIFLA